MKNNIRNILLTFFLGFYFNISAQTISVEKIEEDIKTCFNDSMSDKYWKKIKNLLETNENQLTQDNYYLLYYMQGKKPEKVYPSLFLNTERIKLRSLVADANYKKVIKISEDLIKINPVDITTLVYLAMSIDMDSGDKQNKYYLRMKNIISSILKTGDGKTFETAIKIANIDDDKQIIGFTGFHGISRQDETIKERQYSVWKNKTGEKMYFEYVLLVNP